MALFSFLPFYASSETTFLRVEINPLNRATFFFNELPINFKASIDDSKTLITITLEDVKTRFTTDSIASEGIIRRVYIEKFANQLQIAILLSSPRGFTLAPLEFTNSLMLEVFDWKMLTPAEDNYRMGLLALTDNLAVARKYFELAFNEKIANAGYFLGYLFLKSNMLKEAETTLRKAETLGANIIDLFPALHQTYSLLGDEEQSQRYRTKFFERYTGISFSLIETNSELVDSIFKDVNLNLFEEKVFEQDTLHSDTTGFEVTQLDTIPIKQKEQPEESLLEKILYTLLVLIILSAILLVTLYFKWRKRKQLLASKERFEKELLNYVYPRKPPSKAVEHYKKVESVSKEGVNSTSQSKSRTEANIKQLAEEIISAKRQEEVPITKEELVEREKQVVKMPPRVEIALQIQKEQQELLKKKLKEISNVPIPTSPEKLDKFASEVGISKVSLLAKKNIEAIEKDKSLSEKLYKKFFGSEDK
ncbi:MAG: hypothetical protein N2517_05665 [Ignavibacteria bacterium]|nr:hypothetical protein [Ignavibacteria bacterium]